MGSNKTKTGTYRDSKGRLVVVGGGRYTPGGTGRNASTGDFKKREQTIPRVKKSEKAQTGAEASQRAQARRESGNIPKVQQTNNVPKTVKPSTRYADQSVVTTQSNKAATGAEASQRARAKREGKYTNPRANRDTRFDNDFNNFYEYRYEKADFTDYNPKTDTYTEHWRNLKEDIKKKNKWSDSEFESRWKAYDTARRHANAESEVNSAIDVAKKHPALGTLLQAIYTPQSMIEGAASMITSLLPDNFKAQTSDSPLFTGTRAKEAIKQTVKDEHIKSGVGKGAYDIGTGLGDMVIGAGVPVLGTASLGAQTAARSNMQALERGADPNKAALTGAVSGLISGAMNKGGYDWAFGKEAAATTGKEFLKNVGKAAAKEGLENVTEDVVNLGADKLINEDKSEIGALYNYYRSQGLSDSDASIQVLKDKGVDLGVSALSGAAFGGVMSGVNNIPSLMANISANNSPQINMEEFRRGILKLEDINNGDVGVARKSAEQIDKETRQIEEQLGQMANGNLRSDEYLQLGKTPEYMKEYGDINNPLVMSQNNSFKIAYPKGYQGGKHNTGFRAIAEIPKRTDTPVAVMKSQTQPKSGVVVTDMIDSDGNPVSIPIHMDKRSDMGLVNEVASMQGRGNTENLINASDILYGNKERIRSALSGEGLQLPELKADSDPFLNGRVTDSVDNVNPQQINTGGLRQADLPFNDDYKNLPDADGLGHRQGVNVDIRNMDDGISRDRLIAEQRISKVRSNTLENSGIDNAEELKNVIPEEDFSYISQPEQVTYEAAQSQLNNDWDGSVAKYTADYDKDTISNIRSAQDVDAMMLAHQRLNEAARNAVDPAEKARLYEESRKIALNLRKAGTGAGQQIQAFAKWTRTPEGAVTSAQGFAEEMVENGLKGNPKMANEIKDVTNEISSFLDEMDESAMTRQEIEDMIRDAISRRAQLRKRVTNGDIHKIADAILNDRQYADIQKELEYLATGYEDVDAETLEQVQDIFERAYDLDFNSKERVDLENEAYKLLANKIVPNGGSFRDKVDAWRYLAMLANPTTHIKNITGNLLFGQGMVSAKNTMAALLEEAADRVSKATGGNGIERTKAILTPADKDLVDAANNDALQNAYRELSGNKYYSTGEGIDKAIQPFSNKKISGRAINKAAEGNTNFLNAEDEWAVIAKYRTSLAGFLKANGADASIFNATDKASQNLLESGRQYAINQAEEAAFHQNSAVASWLSGISRTARESNSNAVKALGFATDIVIPFKKTPINILKSAIEYSPAEYIKVATDIPKLNKGLMKPAEFIDDISKATTGTAALGIGALLAYEGILKIGSDKSDEEQAFDKNTGRQNVAIKAGNKYIGMSELIPAAAPLILGATIFETMAGSEGDENALNTIFSGMSAVANGVTDMTMLSGIADTLNSIRFAQDESEVWQKLGIDTMSNLASQMLPTLGRKIETTIDDTKRSTYSDQTGALKTIDQELKYLQTKIPGLQQAGEALQGSSVPFLQSVGDRLALEPNIDVKGQVQDSPGIGGMDNALGRVINNFISPVPITEDQSTVYDDERRRLAEATGETKVLPYIASKEATVDNIQLTPEEWTQYRQARGQMREEVATSMIDSDFYKNASDADKTKLLTDIDTFTKNYSQSKYGKALSGPDQELAEIYEKEGTQGLIKTFIGKDIAASSDISGNTKVAGRIQTAVKNNDIKAAQEIASDTGIITGAGLTPAVADAYQDAKQRIPSLTADNYVAMFKKVDKDGNGSLKQDEIIDAMNRDKKNASTYEKAFWTSDKKKPQKVDGQYKMTTVKSGKSEGTTNTEGKSAKETNKNRIKELNGSGDIQSQLASYGAIDSETTVKYYNHAKQTIPSLTPKQYANKLHEIGGDDYKITQKEMLSYANNKGLSEDDMSKYWNAYGQWKRIPYLSGGTWKAK